MKLYVHIKHKFVASMISIASVKYNVCTKFPVKMIDGSNIFFELIFVPSKSFEAP